MLGGGNSNDNGNGSRADCDEYSSIDCGGSSGVKGAATVLVALSQRNREAENICSLFYRYFNFC